MGPIYVCTQILFQFSLPLDTWHMHVPLAGMPCAGFHVSWIIDNSRSSPQRATSLFNRSDKHIYIERQRHIPDNRAGANKHHHHWAAVVSCTWVKASACLLQVSLSCAVLCQIVSLPYLSRSSLHRLAGLPCHLSFHMVSKW